MGASTGIIVRKCSASPRRTVAGGILNRRLATLRKRAGAAKFTFHDLGRTCITNWARHLPVHVVLKLAGHSDIKNTQCYYLSVQEDDLEKARVVQSEVLGFSGLTPK